MRSLYIITLIVGLFSTSATEASETCHDLASLDWLLGNWRAIQDKAIVLESWQKVSPYSFEGEGITTFAKSDKAASKETLRLVEMSGEVFYMAKIKSNPLPVAFRMTTCSADQAIFENPNHDFPQRLDYQRQGSNRIKVAVTDLTGGGFDVSFTRVSVKERD